MTSLTGLAPEQYFFIGAIALTVAFLCWAILKILNRENA
jgi:hypothetical protein